VLTPIDPVEHSELDVRHCPLRATRSAFSHR
jgi:hypothetical protein